MNLHLTRYQPWSLHREVLNEFNRLFERAGDIDESSSATAEWAPAVDIEEHAAFQAMDVVVPLDAGVVPAGLIGERQLLNQAILGEQVQSSVDRAVGDARVTPAHALEDLASGQMLVGPLDLFQNGRTLGGVLESLAGHDAFRPQLRMSLTSTSQIIAWRSGFDPLRASSTSRAQELLEAFRFLGQSTRLEFGCLGCSAWADPDWTVRYVEEWATEEDMRRRVQSDGFTSLLAVVESGLSRT